MFATPFVKVGTPIADLAAIVRAVNAAAEDRAQIGALVSTLEKIAVFDNVLCLVSTHDRGAFIVCDARGAGVDRSWTHWPLRRLFAGMQPRRITHRNHQAWALAIPLDHGAERFVVLAALGLARGDAQYEPFWSTLESLKIARAARPSIIRDEIPLSPLEPRILAFGLCPALQTVLTDMLARRAWSMTVVPHFRSLRASLDAGEPDLLFIDFDHLPDPFDSVLRIHGMIVRDMRLLGFGDTAWGSLDRQGLIDVLIDHDAPERSIFDRLKRMVRMVPEARKSRLHYITSRAEITMHASKTPLELTNAGARHAADLMRGWASVHLVAESGAVFAAEHPRMLQPLMSGIPKAFLSDGPCFQLRADERFYEELIDDRRVRGALTQMGAVSAASIPLRVGERRLGALVSVSRDTPADSDVFEALANVAKIVTHRFEAFLLASARAAPYESNGVWQCVRHGGLEFAVYRSRYSAVTWDYHSVRMDLGLLSVGTPIGARALERLNACSGDTGSADFFEGLTLAPESFVAVCNPISRTLTFAARRFPVPVLIDATGPTATLVARRETMRGKMAVVPPAGLLILDEPLRRWLAIEGWGADSITEILEDMRPPGLAVIVTANTAG